MISYFWEMSSKIWWIVDVGFSHTLDQYVQTKGKEKCQHLEDQATNVLLDAMSIDILKDVFKL